MKNKLKYIRLVAILGLIAFFGLILASCSTTENYIVYDSSVPEEKLCTLELDYFLTVTSFNNEPVMWKATTASFLSHSLVKARIQIPEGTHAFVVDYHTTESQSNLSNTVVTTYTYTANNINVMHTFEAGKIYVMQAERLSNAVNVTVSLKQ